MTNREPERGHATVTSPRVETAADLHDALFTRHFNATVRLARLLGSDDPEDTAQEAFARLHVHHAGLRDASAALAYVRRTTANLTTSRLRHLRVVRKTPGDLAHEHTSAEDTVVAAERVDHLLHAVRALPARQRQVLILRYWMDLPLAEIADALDIPLGTVKSTLSRAHLERSRCPPNRERCSWSRATRVHAAVRARS